MINEPDRLQLLGMVRSRSMPHSLVRRAHIVLLWAKDNPIGKWRGAASAVSYWRRRL